MAIPTHIFVTAAEGREVPVPLSEGSAPGGVLKRCKPGKVHRLQNTTFTRRRIVAGDLHPTTIGGVKVAELELAAAGEDIESLGYHFDDEGAVVLKPKIDEPAKTEPAAPAEPAKTTNPRKG